jgi:tetratricopeptide (TPR) repeat protein
MAGVCCATQDVDHAQAWMRQGATLLEGLTESQPDEPAYHNELAELQSLRAFLSISLNQPVEAQVAFASAAEQYRLALALDGGSAVRNAYAWLLADCPCAAIRDPRQAVDLARQAIAIDPGEHRYWNTLGVACYRSGDFAACVEALEKSVRLGGGYPHDWFFLAMAYQHQGELSQARDWHARAMDWMNQHPQAPQELKRYEAEASALFGSPTTAGSKK